MTPARTKWLHLSAGVLLGTGIAVVVAGLAHAPTSELVEQRLRAGLVGLVLLLLALERRIRPPAWLERVVLAALCPLALAAYFSFLSPFDGRILHRHDLFHSYLGAKYADELSYTRIYSCTALAQAELGQSGEVRARTIRVLTDDSVAPGAQILARAGSECRPHFSAQRWSEFVRDVGTLRAEMPLETWDDVQLDHGFNAPPAWLLLGHPLASLHAPTTSFLYLISRIDLLLIAGSGMAVAWAFGLRTLALFAVYLGCQLPGGREWLGGCLLRFDWVFASVLGIAALARRRHALAGAALGSAAVLRLFPALLLVGPAIAIAARSLEQRRLSHSARRLLGAAVLTATAELVLAAAAYGAPRFAEFAQHIRVHETQRGVNSMGLGFVLEHDVFHGDAPSRANAAPDENFGLAWAARHERRNHALAPWRLLAAGLVLALLYRARRRPLWVTAILSLALVGFGLVLSCYYWVVFCAWALLARVVPRAERLVLWSLFAAGLIVTMPAFSARLDDVYAWQSVIFLLMSGTLLAWLALPHVKKRTAGASKSAGRFVF